MPSGALWAVITLMASATQTMRNAMQRDLLGALGAVGAAQVRFLFGFPFSLVFLALVLAWSGEAAPPLTARTLAFAVLGALAQIAATSLMLAAMRARSFVVVIALTKTEAAQAALFGLVVLGDRPTAAVIAAIAIASAGVALMSFRREALGPGAAGAAALGLLSAAFFALAAVSFRAAVTGVASPSRVLAASMMLVVGLALQTALLGLYLAVFDREAARKILAAWRSSLFAGFMGALSSQFWFVAFALTDAARVRTLALVEVLFAQLVSQKVFREPPSLRESLGMALIVVAAVLLIASAA